MSILLETTLGDVVIDLDVVGSPNLCRNILKLTKARYYTNSLVYNVVPGRFCQFGDPRGDGTGGCSIYGLIDSVQTLMAAQRQQPGSTENGGGADNIQNGSSLTNVPIDVTQSTKRFLRSEGRELTPTELSEKGRVVAVEMGGVRHTIGSQFIVTIDGEGKVGEGRGLDGLSSTSAGGDATGGGGGKQTYLSLGTVVEDTNDVLGQMNASYVDDDGRPYADVRIVRALVLDDPFPDPEGLNDVLAARGVILAASDEDSEDANDNEGGNDGRKDPRPESRPPRAIASPEWDRPPEERVEIRISANDEAVKAVAMAGEEEEEKAHELALEREEQMKKKEDKSRAVVLEMLGDLPSADMKPPENVLFVCKLNPVTDDEDLELIFSRFDPNAKADIIRDPDTGDSLQYAFVEFTTKEQCSEAYFKMNNALVDDRRIKVDFSQSVAKIWNKYTQRRRGGGGGAGRGGMPGRGRGGRGHGRGGGWNGGRGRGRGEYGRQQRVPQGVGGAAGSVSGDPRANNTERDTNRSSRWGNNDRNGAPQAHPQEKHRHVEKEPSRSRSRSRSGSSSRDRRKRKRRDRRSRSRSRTPDREKRRHKHSSRHGHRHHHRDRHGDGRRRESRDGDRHDRDRRHHGKSDRKSSRRHEEGRHHRDERRYEKKTSRRRSRSRSRSRDRDRDRKGASGRHNSREKR